MLPEVLVHMMSHVCVGPVLVRAGWQELLEMTFVFFLLQRNRQRDDGEEYQENPESNEAS